VVRPLLFRRLSGARITPAQKLDGEQSPAPTWVRHARAGKGSSSSLSQSATSEGGAAAVGQGPGRTGDQQRFNRGESVVCRAACWRLAGTRRSEGRALRTPGECRPTGEARPPAYSGSAAAKDSGRRPGQGPDQAAIASCRAWPVIGWCGPGAAQATPPPTTATSAAPTSPAYSPRDPGLSPARVTPSQSKTTRPLARQAGRRFNGAKEQGQRSQQRPTQPAPAPSPRGPSPAFCRNSRPINGDPAAEYSPRHLPRRHRPCQRVEVMFCTEGRKAPYGAEEFAETEHLREA